MNVPTLTTYATRICIFGVVLMYTSSYLRWIYAIIGIFIVAIWFQALPITQKPKPKHLKGKPGKPRKVPQEKLKSTIFPQSKRVSHEIDMIIDLIVRDFVSSWYQRVDVKSQSEFPDCVRLMLRDVVVKLQQKICCHDISSLVVLKLIPIVTKYINTFCAARSTMMNEYRSNISNLRHFELRTALEFNKIYRLHKGLSLKSGKLETDISMYMDKRASDLIQMLLNDNERTSRFVQILLREILSKNILTPMVTKFCDPDRWNLLIVSLSKKIIDERNQVQEVKTILARELQDDQLNSQLINDSTDHKVFDFYIKEDMSTKEFEKYLRGLSLVTSISDLRTGKFILTTELMKLNEESNLSKKQSTALKSKIKLSLGMIDSKLKSLSESVNDVAKDDKKTELKQYTDNDILNKADVLHGFEDIIQSITFEDIINDEYCFECFTNFLHLDMNRRGFVFIQYWKSVEEFKNPLEDADQGQMLLEVSQLDYGNIEFIFKRFMQGNDLQYMESLDKGLVANIVLFNKCEDKPMNVEIFLLAKKSMLLLQTAAEEILEHQYLVQFKKSAFFLKMVSSPNFMKTELSSKYFTGLQIGNNRSRPTIPTRKVSLNGVEVLANPGLNDAIEDILNNTAKSPSSKKYLKEGSLENAEDENTKSNPNSSSFMANWNSSEDDIFSGNPSPVKKDVLKAININNGTTSNEVKLLETSKSDIHNNPPEYSNIKELISALTVQIFQLQKELDLLNHLILKAKLTNNQSQLNILNQSHSALLKDIRKKQTLRQQYMVEENEISLYGKTTVSIRSYILDYEMSNLKEVAYYIINISHTNGDITTSWDMPRRFTEFANLNSYLIKNYKPVMRSIIKQEIFPAKISMSLKYHTSQCLLYERRQEKFQTYLQELLKIPQICEDDTFRRFLSNANAFSKSQKDSRARSAPRRIINSNRLTVTKSAGTAEHASQSDMSNENNASDRISNFSSISTTSISPALTPEQQSDQYQKQTPIVKKENTTPENNLHKFTPSPHKEQQDMTNFNEASNKRSFIRPICDLFISIFSSYPTGYGDSAPENDYWLRGGAIILLLQQLLGSTIEKYIRDTFSKLYSEPKLYDMFLRARTSLWGPGGYFETRQRDKLNPPPERTESEKKRTYHDSQLLFRALMVETSAKVVGLHHSKEASAKIHDILQNPYISASIFLDILDLLLDDILLDKENI
ncbi:Mdm1 protein [Maudiozyma humilis]|uniref:Mdm1 protein n=1 Tax=Maudiozyma humilis TaxID=51915 RepID=A0AAV5S493_MAUHU|nr:Mdm1 protein [Kazachstania humilis]